VRERARHTASKLCHAICNAICRWPAVFIHVSNQHRFHGASLSQDGLQPLGAFFTIVRRENNSLADKTKTQSPPAAARADLFLNPADSNGDEPSIQPLPHMHIQLIIAVVPAAIFRETRYPLPRDPPMDWPFATMNL
jgi:hypothetical protein